MYVYIYIYVCIATPIYIYMFNFQDVFHISSSNFIYIYIYCSCIFSNSNVFLMDAIDLATTFGTGMANPFKHPTDGGFHGFLKWKYSNSWMVYDGKSEHQMDDDWGYAHDLGNIHIKMNRTAFVHAVHVNTFSLDFLTGTILGQ